MPGAYPRPGGSRKDGCPRQIFEGGGFVSPHPSDVPKVREPAGPCSAGPPPRWNNHCASRVPNGSRPPESSAGLANFDGWGVFEESRGDLGGFFVIATLCLGARGFRRLPRFTIGRRKNRFQAICRIEKSTARPQPSRGKKVGGRKRKEKGQASFPPPFSPMDTDEPHGRPRAEESWGRLCDSHLIFISTFC